MKLKAPTPRHCAVATPDAAGGLPAQSRPPARSTSSGIAFKSRVLRDQMRLRGLSGAALAQLARVSDATISNALAGRRLHPATFRRIAAALYAVELVPGMDTLAAPREVELG